MADDRTFAERNAEPYRLDDDERNAVRQGLQESERDEYASDEAALKVLRGPWR